MTGTRSFGADARLKDGGDFRRVFEGGRKLVGPRLVVWRRMDPSGRPPRLGLSVGAKVGGAVRRNRLKRLLREAFRLGRSGLPPGLEVVAHPRPGCPWRTLADAKRDLFELLDRNQ